mgnify:FL=1
MKQKYLSALFVFSFLLASDALAQIHSLPEGDQTKWVMFDFKKNQMVNGYRFH